MSFLLVTQATLLGYSSVIHSPVVDEPGHMIAGISHWQLGRYELYRVNPPLVRMIAALPALAMRPTFQWESFDGWLGARYEFLLGEQLIGQNPERWPRFFIFGRLALIPFMLLGGWFCFAWAKAMGGQMAGLIALALWVFSPDVIAHGSLITPDASAAVAGVGANYMFWRWLRQSSWTNAALAGFALGCALSTKMTWIILFPIWVLVCIACRFARSPVRGRWDPFVQLFLMASVGLLIVGSLYGFCGCFRKLGDYTFVSPTLTGISDTRMSEAFGGNRFQSTWFGALPIPFPEEYVLGLDRQKLEFDGKDWSFFCGEWKRGGWWYFYLVAIVLKSPAGFCVLMSFAAFGAIRFANWRQCVDHTATLFPAVGLLAVVSSETGFSHHFRYVLPALPLLFVWISVNVVRGCTLLRSGAAVGAVVLSVVAYAAESIAVYPHSLSFISYVFGGPTQGSTYLGSSCIDWGQDLFLLRRWVSGHPEAHPFFATYYSPDGPEVGATRNSPAVDPRSLASPYSPNYVDQPEFLPPAGWYAVSVTAIQDWKNGLLYLRGLTPVARVGYSINIYHLADEDVRRIREQVRSTSRRRIEGSQQMTGVDSPEHQ